MVFNTTFNNISVISWRSVLMVEETRVAGENNRPAACRWQTLSHNVVSRTGFKLTTFMVIGTDCTSSCKFNYHTITTVLKNMNNLMVTGTYSIILYINQHFLLKFLYLYMYMNSTAVKKRYCRVNKHLIILIIVLTHLGHPKTKHAFNCHHLIIICHILATRRFQPNVDGKEGF